MNDTLFNHPTEYGYTIRTRAKVRIIEWAIALCLFFILIPSLFVAPSRKVKVQFLLISSAFVVCGQIAKSLSQDSRILSNDFESAARQARRQNLYSAYTEKPVIADPSYQQAVLVPQAAKATTAQQLLAAPVDQQQEEFLFDIEDAFSRPEFPHIMLVAPSGSGKTTTLNWLAAIAAKKGHEVTVLTPHIMKRSEFAEYERVTNDLEIYNYIDKLATDMKVRYTMQPWEDYCDNYPVRTIIIDEAVTLFESFKEFDKDYELEVEKSWVKLLVEARKVGIKIILATQSNRVGAIGLKGRGDIADCLIKMLIGRSAKKRVTTLLKKKEWTAEQAAIARSHAYFAVIDDDTTNRLLPIPTQS